MSDEWIQDMLAMPSRIRQLDSNGCLLTLRCWGDGGRPGLLLVHGGAAHGGWWHCVAAALAADYHCVAVDLSGHGDSGRRPSYPAQVWIDELTSLVDDGFFRQPPVLIGHSMGGLLGIGAGRELGNRLAGLVIVDAAARPDSGDRQPNRAINLLGRKRSYASRDEAIARFRLLPPQPGADPELLSQVAAQSVCQAEGRWQWKYDYRAYRDRQPMAVFDFLSALRCPVAIVRGEYSVILDRNTQALMKSRLAVPSLAIEIPSGHHHLMLDQPLALTTALRTILACWDQEPGNQLHISNGDSGIT